jgi:hypothetical protein
VRSIRATSAGTLSGAITGCASRCPKGRPASAKATAVRRSASREGGRLEATKKSLLPEIFLWLGRYSHVSGTTALAKRLFDQYATAVYRYFRRSIDDHASAEDLNTMRTASS